MGHVSICSTTLGCFYQPAEGGLEFITFNYPDRKQEKAAVKPPLPSIGCCGVQVTLQQSLIPHNNGDYCNRSAKLWKVKNSAYCRCLQ